MAEASERVLVIEDDASTRALLDAVLAEAGIESDLAGDGEEGLRVARAHRPRLVILDVHLPGISGYEVCRALREEFGDTLPIIFLSGERIESFDRVGGLLLGGDDYLTKPFATDELLARVRRCLRRPQTIPTGATSLTPRECDVLSLLAQGEDQPAISSLLSISTKTVSTHIEHILGKLGVQSRAQAVAVAYQSGLVTARDAVGGPARRRAQARVESAPMPARAAAPRRPE
jgi:DNA-binding NarL/FixJ family response regulator